METIEQRIKELEAEISAHRVRLGELNQAIGQLQTTIISKTGAVIELKKLLIPAVTTQNDKIAEINQNAPT